MSEDILFLFVSDNDDFFILRTTFSLYIHTSFTNFWGTYVRCKGMKNDYCNRNIDLYVFRSILGSIIHNNNKNCQLMILFCVIIIFNLIFIVKQQFFFSVLDYIF